LKEAVDGDQRIANGIDKFFHEAGEVNSETTTTTTPSRTRLLIGGIFFVSGFATPLLIPIVMSSNLPAGWKTLLSGLLALGIPEIFMLIAAGILGKQGFAYLKSKLWQWIAPPETVSLLRYRVGLLMFFVPVLFIWLHPYLEQASPELADKRVNLGLLSVSLMTASLLVLGGEFWDKLRGLFLYKMRVVQPVDQMEPTSPNTAQVKDTTPPSRMLIGGLFFVLSLLLPGFIPLLQQLPLSDEARLVFGGLMVFGIPQLLMLAAVAILGKPGFAYLKQRLGGLFKGLLASQVSHGRYRLGVLLLATPILIGFSWPYLTMVFDALHRYKYEIAITGDLMLVVAVFVLGGEFWEKLVSLFRHQSRVTSS